MTSPIGDQTHASNGEVSGFLYNIYIILGFLGSKLFVTVFLSHKFSISIGTEENNAGQTLGVRGGSEWDFLYPQGLRKFLNYAKNKYESPKFMITENGNNFIRSSLISLTQFNPGYSLLTLVLLKLFRTL